LGGIVAGLGEVGLRFSHGTSTHVGLSHRGLAIEALADSAGNIPCRQWGVAAHVFFDPLAFVGGVTHGQVVLSEVVQASAYLGVQEGGEGRRVTRGGLNRAHG